METIEVVILVLLVVIHFYLTYRLIYSYQTPVGRRSYRRRPFHRGWIPRSKLYGQKIVPKRSFVKAYAYFVYDKISNSFDRFGKRVHKFTRRRNNGYNVANSNKDSLKRSKKITLVSNGNKADYEYDFNDHLNKITASLNATAWNSQDNNNLDLMGSENFEFCDFDSPYSKLRTYYKQGPEPIAVVEAHLPYCLATYIIKNKTPSEVIRLMSKVFRKDLATKIGKKDYTYCKHQYKFEDRESGRYKVLLTDKLIEKIKSKLNG